MSTRETIEPDEGDEGTQTEVSYASGEEHAFQTDLRALNPGERNTILCIEANPSYVQSTQRYLAEHAPAFRCLALSFEELDTKIRDELHTIKFVIIFLDRSRPDLKLAMAAGAIVAQELRRILKGLAVEIYVCSTDSRVTNHLLLSGCHRSMYKPPAKERLDQLLYLLAAR